MKKQESTTQSPTVLIMPFADAQEEREWDEIAHQINERGN